MSQDLLSQEEIDALLRGAGLAPRGLSAKEQEVLREALSVFASSVVGVLSMLAGKEVSGELSSLEERSAEELSSALAGTHLLYGFRWDGEVSGPSFVLASEHDALVISDLMMGGNGLELPPSMNELYLSAANEAMSQALGASATSLASVVGGKLLVKDASGALVEPSPAMFEGVEGSSRLAVGELSFRVSEVGEIALRLAMPLDVARAFAERITAVLAPEEAPQEEPKPQPPSPRPQPKAAPAPSPQRASSPSRPVQEPSVRPVEFAPLVPSRRAEVPSNIELVLDVPVTVSVELGRASKTVREVLAFAPGAVIELDKLAGEPVDILVNGKLVARGEVVVVDENFGVRVTEIVAGSEAGASSA